MIRVKRMMRMRRMMRMMRMRGMRRKEEEAAEWRQKNKKNKAMWGAKSSRKKHRLANDPPSSVRLLQGRGGSGGFVSNTGGPMTSPNS